MSEALARGSGANTGASLGKAAAARSLRTFYGVQWLRGLAALMVVMFHAASNLSGGANSHGFRSLPVLACGNAGVDLFFIISGFVIVWTTQDDWWRPAAWHRFLVKRVSRVFPLYWVLTTGKIILVLALPSLFRGTHLRPWNTIASYLLIPSLDAEGRISPVITAGWTLCFEMAFYYVCTACLAMRRMPLMLATPLFVVLGLLGTVRAPHWGAVGSLINPLLLEFVAGMWIAELTRRNLVRLRPAVIATMLAAGVGLWLASDLLPPATAFAWRALVWGAPAAIILLAVIGLEPRFEFKAYRVPMLIGNASYSIYLTHVLVLPPLVARLRTLNMSAAGEWAVYCPLVVLGLGAGVVVWWVVERKLIRGVLGYSRPIRSAWLSRRKPA